MPKQDRFATMKKEADKGRKKVNEEKRKDAKLAAKDMEEEDEQTTKRTVVSSAPTSGKQPKTAASNSSFAKASLLTGGDDDEDDEDATEVPEVTEAVSSKARKDAKAEAKKQQASRKKDEFAMLAEQEKLAARERVKERFLRMFMVGLIKDLLQGKNGASNGNHASDKKEKKEKKPKKKDDDEVKFSFKVVKEKIDMFSGPFLLFVIVAAVLYGKAMEDTYAPGDYDSEANFYDVMGIPRDSSIMDVRRKYKSLALSWHPDKNPGCTSCAEKFAAISKAYETLSEPEQKKAYDSKRAAKGSLSSASSVDLTGDDFESKVLRSNDVWYVQVYDPSDRGSGGFHPIWEHAAAQLTKVAKFGRLDVSKHKKAMSYLPHRVVIMPAVFRFARGHAPEEFLWAGRSEEEGSGPVVRFVQDTYPGMQHEEDAAGLKKWWSNSARPRLLIAGNGPVIRRGAANQQFLHIIREAHLWSEFFEVNAADHKLAIDALQPLGVELPPYDKKGSKTWSVTWCPEGADAKAQTLFTDDIKELPSKIEDITQRALVVQAPHLTMRNFRQLCEAGTASRTFCLFLVDVTSQSQVSQILKDLATSRSEYAKELDEMKDTDQEVAEEPFRIQPVRVMTSTSRYPSGPVSVGSAFYAAWAEVGRAPMFIMELETQRVSAVKQSILNGLYQQVAYEDLRLKELPEEVQLARGLPDPEASVKREVLRFVTTPLGAMITFVLLAAAQAVAPELPLAVNLGGLASFLVLVILVWPFACRRFLAKVTLQA